MQNYFQIKDGILTFNDLESYSYIVNNAIQISVPQDNKKLEFNSLQSIYDQIHTRLGEFEDDEENDFFAFIKSNKKYIELKDYGNDEQEVVNRTDVIEDRFANKDFVFMIGENIYDVREIQADVNSNLSKMFGCGREITSEVINNNSGWKNDRKGKLRVRAQRGVGGEECIPQIGIKLSGQRRRFFVWINYTTALRLVGNPVASATFRALNPPVPFLYTTITAPTPIPFIGFSSCDNCFSIERATVQSGSNLPSVDCQGDYFLSALVDVSGTTQGLNGAIINVSCTD